MPRYQLPGSGATIFYRQGRRRALEALLVNEGTESIGTLLGKAPFRAVSLLVQYGVDRGANGIPAGESVLPPAIEMGEADALIDQALEEGTTIGDLGGELIGQYLGTVPKKSDDASPASGPVPTPTPNSP
jgi:hypothetical protein